MVTNKASGQGEFYTFSMLSQESVNIVGEPVVAGFVEEADTSYTVYKNCSVDFKTYFVNGAQYDNIFNPNPTGLYLNNQHFVYYCGIEMSIRQNYNNILDVKEFSYLGKSYLMIINFREDCDGEGCRYRCYNVFDITKPEKIIQVSFSSLFEGIDTFGEFNSDGIIDFVRVAPKASPDAKEGKENFLVTIYTIPRRTAKQLTNGDGHANYLYIEADPEIQSFQILQADWLVPVKDTTGNIAENSSYFAPYISFDPLYRYLYTPDGVRVEKNKWSVFVRSLGDLEAAQGLCRRLSQKKLGDAYIMIDQYSGDIKFEVFVGNFVSKKTAEQYFEKLKEEDMEVKLRDLRNGY
ncbi:SPOR domain-containing protein [Flammeovirgaceae bacterium SG7u.111]|nr:SPOR domain-containing protein [Flammeovirgaceae bacterium SG7u.132]WPO35685.1 SPOR domain-containing protein [Flammeovirgaceae bacterium SG7u.111]